MGDLENLLGQDKAVAFLRSCIENQSLSHAYLFYGPAGVGKMAAALAFATEILEKEDPGGRALLSAQAHPDLFLIERITDKTRLGKEQVGKPMQSWLGLKPYRTRHRVVIIRDAHLLTPEAGNALLKTLEEPPEYAILILVSDEGLVMETIASRCQPVRFQALPEEDIIAILSAQGAEPERAGVLARLSQGSVAAALEFAHESGLNEKWEKARYYVTRIAAGDMGGLFEAAEAVEKAPHLLSHMLSTILRDVYVYKSTKNASLLMDMQHREVAETLPEASLERLAAALNHMQDLHKQLRYNVNPLTVGINMAYAVRGVFWD